MEKELLREEEAARQAAIKKEVGNAVKQTKNQVLEANNIDSVSHTASVTSTPDKTDSSSPKLDETTANHIQSTNDGKGNNYEADHVLSDVADAQRKAQEQAKGELEGKGITAENTKDKGHDRDDY